ncbi:hypothetical protein [Tardiphaga sp. 813_E8_N1_3]|uniref:hypothetical protein n=1 Tax=Tardiphaga sp. 813_E8_N1_3 TaxID=3240760 RepID=UPI003F2916F6
MPRDAQARRRAEFNEQNALEPTNTLGVRLNGISAETERAENARRGILGLQFDEDEWEIDPVTGQPIKSQPIAA